jgi:hypothetical protein
MRRAAGQSPKRGRVSNAAPLVLKWEKSFHNQAYSALAFAYS